MKREEVNYPELTASLESIQFKNDNDPLDDSGSSDKRRPAPGEGPNRQDRRFRNKIK